LEKFFLYAAFYIYHVIHLNVFCYVDLIAIDYQCIFYVFPLSSRRKVARKRNVMQSPFLILFFYLTDRLNHIF